MSKSDQEKIKQAVDLLIDKDTDLTSFFAKDGMLKVYWTEKFRQKNR